MVIDEHSALTDAEGRFTFDKVVPMPGIRVMRQDPEKTPGRVWSMGEPINVEDGKTTVVTLGARGARSSAGSILPQAWTGQSTSPMRCSSGSRPIRRSRLTPLSCSEGRHRSKTEPG